MFHAVAQYFQWFHGFLSLCEINNRKIKSLISKINAPFLLFFVIFSVL